MQLNQPQWTMPATQSSMRLAGDELETSATPAVADDAVEEGISQDTRQMQPIDIRFERRNHRRFDVETLSIDIERWDGRRDSRLVFGQVIDLSAGGVRLRTRQAGIRSDQQIRVRLELPDNGGIFPFVDTAEGSMKPKREWVGWLAVARVKQIGNEFDIAGRLVDMEEMDRGMLGLYLSTRAIAA